MNEIGTRLRALRESVRLTQAEIAKLCGSNQTTIGKTEAGKTAPTVKLLIWYANYFDVSLDYICCRTDQPQGKLYDCKPPNDLSAEERKQFINACFDPNSPLCGRLKDALLKLMEENRK